MKRGTIQCVLNYYKQTISASLPALLNSIKIDYFAQAVAKNIVKKSSHVPDVGGFPTFCFLSLKTRCEASVKQRYKKNYKCYDVMLTF